MQDSISARVLRLLFVCSLSLLCQVQGRVDESVKLQSIPYGKVEVLNEADRAVYSDCGSLLRAGYNISGTYRVKLNDKDVLLPCEFRDGNAFNVILRRWSNSLSFIQPWHVYENGFGHPQDNYWAGLANIYILTLQGNHNLQINMQDWASNNQNAVYSGFYLEHRETRYRMHVGPYRGSLPDDFTFHNNMPFSTYDAPDPKGCAASMRAGWWYNYCALTLPTGVYYQGGWYNPTGSMYDGMFWKDWYGFNYSLKFLSMTISS